MSRLTKQIVGTLIIGMVGGIVGGGFAYLFYSALGVWVFAVGALAVIPLGMIGGSIISLWANWEA